MENIEIMTSFLLLYILEYNKLEEFIMKKIVFLVVSISLPIAAIFCQDLTSLDPYKERQKEIKAILDTLKRSDNITAPTE